MKEFRASGADVILIQETHFRAGDSFKFASKYFPTSHTASDSSGKAGVAILIRRSCSLHIQSTHLDPHGRYIIMQCVYMSHPITIMNVYAPNSGEIKFLTEAFKQLQHFSQAFMMIGGDFNAILSPTWDRRSPIPHQTTPPSAILIHILSQTDTCPPPVWHLEDQTPYKQTVFILSPPLTKCSLDWSTFLWQPPPTQHSVSWIRPQHLVRSCSPDPRPLPRHRVS